MTETLLAKTWKAFDRLSKAAWIIVIVLLAIAFIVSGLAWGKMGVLWCGIGWIVGMIAPLFLKNPPRTRLTRLLRIAGVLIFVLGLVVHGGAL